MDAHSGSTSSWDYLDFELEIRGGGPRKYPVAVRSPAGEAQAEMRFPFDEWELKDRLQALEIALLRSGGTRRRIASPEEHTVQDFGRGLFESLLVGEVRTRYEMSLSEARRQGKGLRLKLRIQPSELAVLPWEFLYDAERDRYPSLSTNTPLVRYLDLPQSVEPLRVSPPLRVLGMVASPSGLDPLDVKHEKRLVEEAIRGLREDGVLEITWLEGQTWRHLMRAMRRGPWHIFHFVGHGGFDPATEEGAIALSNDAGHMHLLRARSLAELLDDHYPLRLVFLNSCEGARGSESDAFSSTAATLVRRGVPAVVAMQYEVTDRAAIEFSRDFYEALADSLPVDAAVTEARAAVSMDSILEWGTPVLYMHSPDGRVFDVLAAAPRAHPPPETEERQEVDLLRRYREDVESAWVDRKLQANEVQRLRDLANNELGLSPVAAADIEREVMGDTIEAILKRQEQMAEEEDKRNQLGQLYAQARQLHQNREWQAVVDVFARIYLDDANYPDPEGLLASAHEGLETARKEEESLRQYRESVESAWTSGELDRRQAEPLRDLANELRLNSSTAADIERTVMGDTKEALLASRERAAKERYRNVVEEAWADNHVSDAATEQLVALARELDLSMDTVVAIERDVMGDTKEAILERQEQAAREKEQLDELYARARRSHQDQDWQQVVDLFEQISAEDPAYADREGLLASAHEALETRKQEQRVAAIYAEGLRNMDAREWQQALDRFEEVLLLEPGYRDVGTQLSQARVELSRLQPLTADQIQCVRILTEHKKAVNAVAFSPDGQLLASCSGGVLRRDDTVRLWRVENGELLHVLKGHSSVVTSVAFSPSGELLASGSGDRMVRLWRVENGELLRTLEGYRGSTESVAFSPSGELLASGSDDTMVRLWRVDGGELLRTLEGDRGSVRDVAFSPSGELLASGSGDRMVRLWRVENGELLRTLEGHTSVVTSVAFSPSGELLASGSDDTMVRLWRVDGGELLHTLEGHTGFLRTLEGTLEGYRGCAKSVAFSPSGELLASGSDDRMVRLWRVENGELLHGMMEHSGVVTSVAFSPSGELLASGSDDKTVRLWGTM